jgi:hypothetical protein
VLARPVLIGQRMNKPALLAIVGVLGLCGGAVAAPKSQARKAAPAKRLNCGESYVVGKKDAGRTALSQTQVEDVLKTKVGEVEACWTKLPADQRKKDVAAVLTVEIDDTGEVQTVEVAGVPEETQRCVAIAAVAWEFPRTDVKADAASYAFPVALKAK